MLFRTLLRMIERGQTKGLAEKIDVLWVAGKLTDDEYYELTGLMPSED